MGRKIPARKHHGVRDPIKQNEQRLALIKDKINDPPVKQDFQKVSHKFADFIKLKDEVKSGAFHFKKPKPQTDDKPENYTSKKHVHRNNKQLPAIVRHQNESDADYLRRVNRVTRASIQESQFEAKYGVEVVRNAKTGEIKLKKRPKDELEEQMKRKRKENATGGKHKGKVAEVKLTASEQKALVKKLIGERKEKEATKTKVEEYKRDEVKFGEVVHGPPQLSTPRKATKADTVPRPGRKQLLLHSVISGTVKDARQPAKTNQTSFDLKGKRKELPTGTRHMIENQQKAAVELYRELKKKNRVESIR